MKKLMKAIAFATVMCMLLSTAAFAANPDAVLDSETDYKFDVTVTTGSAEQVALLILKNGTELEDAASGDILYINQDEAVAVNGGYAVTFEDVQVDAADVEDGMVDIYAGYATAGGAAVDYKNFVVVNQEEISISLVGEPTIYLDIEAWAKEYIESESADATIKAQLEALAVPENDKATVVLTTVNFANLGDKTVSRMVWKFGIADGTARYIEVAPSAYGLDSSVLNGPVKLGVSFINGSKNGSRTALNVNDADLLFALSDNSIHNTEN